MIVTGRNLTAHKYYCRIERETVLAMSNPLICAFN